MGKIKNFSLMVLSLLMMTIMAVSCMEDLTENRARAQSSEWFPMPWNLEFKHTVDPRGSEYETQWITTERTYNIREVCSMLAKVSHKDDRYAVADKYRNVSADYSNSHMTVSAVDVKTSGTAMRREFKYSQRFTAEVEDGNLIYLDWNTTRIALQDTIENRMVYLPFDSIVSARVKSIESLPGNTKYKTRGDDTYVSDSIVRKVTWEVERVAIGNTDSDPTVFEVSDMFKVLLLSKNDIADAKEENVSRVVLDETTERCSFDEVFTMKSGEKHTNPHNIILTREFITVPEWEMVVKNTGYAHKELSPLARGTIKTVSDKDNWTVREQTDEFKSTASAEGEKDVVFPYKFRHQGAKYKDDYVEVDFALIALTTLERNTWTEDATSPRDGYNARRLKNATATNYLDFDQDVSESMLLLKENVHPTSEGWKKDECIETITENEVIWKLIYVIDYSDGSKDRIPFEFKDTRSLVCKSDWKSIEKNTKHSTSGVTVKLTSTESKSAKQNDATAKWDRISNDLTSVATLNASKQENKWVSVEPTNVSVTYRDKTFTFEKHSIKATNTDNVGAAVKSEGAEVSKYTATLNYVWGSNTKTSVAPGTITVKDVVPTDEGWKKDECTETITEKQVVWKLVYIINYSDGTQQKIPFEFSDSRSLTCESNWKSVEKNTKHSTSGVNVTTISTEAKSATQNGATAKWNRMKSALSSIATLDASKQENKWTSVEPTDVSVTYRNKTFTFNKNSIKASNTDNVGSAVKSGNSEVSKYTATLNYVWGNNTKTSNAPGSITVNAVVPTSEDWSKSECTETITEKQVVWKLVYIINYSDGTQQKIPFEFKDSRSLTCESNWKSVEKNTKHSTSGVNVTTTSTESKSAEQNGATAKWNRVKSSLSSVVTLDASKQQNKWTSVEPTNVSVTYRNKTFSFNKNSIKATNTDNVGSAVKSGNSEVSKYTATLNYVWGNNTKTSAAPGSITVNAVVPTSEDWSKSECSETVTDNQVVWKLVYIINYSDGTQQRFPFQFSDSRSLTCESNWTSIESNTNHSTSGVNVNTVSTESKSAEQNGATAKWNRLKSSLSSVVTLAGSKQQNKWTSVEPTDVSVTYRNKTYTFSKNSIMATNTDKLGSAVKNGDYEDYKYTAALNYVWSNNTKSLNAPGVIRVKAAPENTFFPPEWGSLLSAKQTLSNNRNHNGYVYVWSLHFEKGVLPVIILSGNTSPNWEFDYFEYTSNHEYNSAVWQKDKNTWVNAVASDPRNMMLWSRNSVGLANKDRDEAHDQNWDEGHTVDGKCSVFTSRYKLDVTNGRLTATDTYRNIYMGSWK